MDKVTLDFENNIVEWNNDNQKGTEHCPDLRERKAAILAAMGYETYDMSEVINTVNAFANGEMTVEELQSRLDAESNEENK